MVNLANHLVEKNINVMLVCDIDINKDVSELYPGTSKYPLNVKEVMSKWNIIKVKAAYSYSVEAFFNKVVHVYGQAVGGKERCKITL